jgi:hypothetical protein
MRSLLVLAGLGLAFALLAGCSHSGNTRTLTERQRDSTLATEPLPGASTVSRALKASDRAASDAARMDAQVDSIGR